jgi:hypothetical protein
VGGRDGWGMRMLSTHDTPEAMAVKMGEKNHATTIGTTPCRQALYWVPFLFEVLFNHRLQDRRCHSSIARSVEQTWVSCQHACHMTPYMTGQHNTRG